ncbi:MAG: carboxy terminal-processing peptidase [Xanthomonadales bacterium]|nr:carboxy terminal-processing peptidase [Xanthomonadales bacterium]MBP6078515.1 carboxy terminal-processing peptidase [Xanthomonadales bacterium]MBP7623477.1 carboxy terminal-processing peptidase [Xanthomonadales bacterium]
MNLRLIAAIAFVVAPFGVALTKSEAAAVYSYKPSSEQAQAALLATRFLTNFHYKRVPLDDAMSKTIFDRYLESLDGDKLFLTAADVSEFRAYADALDDAIFDQRLAPPFEIYARYVQRVAERTAHARALLAKGFDFGVDEQYRFDREHALWAADAKELDELWRLRVKNDWLRLKLAGRDDQGIRDTLDKRYAGFEKRLGELDGDDVFQTFMNAYSSAIEPHTNYMSPRASENFNIQMRLSLEGIGAVLSREDEYTTIRQIVKGGPADLSDKLQVGDRIVAVGQGDKGALTDVVGWRIDDVVDLIRGKKGTTVRLDVLAADAGADGKPVQLTLVRDKVRLEEQAAKSELIEVGTGKSAHRIGVVRLPTFYHDFEGARRGDANYASSTRDVAKLIKELKGKQIDGLVIDLRGNGGGSLTEASDLSGLFIDEGPVVQVRDAQGRVTIEGDAEKGAAWDGPLAVMIDRESASASEIFAAAMQDFGRALIIGENSFGKGTVQNLIDLDQYARDPSVHFGQLKLTVAQFFRINGGSTQHRGVVPDIAYPQTAWGSEDFGESSLDFALPYTEVKAADFVRSGDLSALKPLLETRHETRIAKDQEFKWWFDDLAEYQKQRERKDMSLLESARRSERDQNELKRAERKAARIAAGIDPPGKESVDGDDGLLADERRNDKAAADAEDAVEKPDFLLREGAYILADAIDLLSTDQRLAAQVKSFDLHADKPVVD